MAKSRGSKSKSKSTKTAPLATKRSARRIKSDLADRASIHRGTTRKRRDIESDPGCDIEMEQLVASGRLALAAVPMGLPAAAARSAPPKAVPEGDPVPFAKSMIAPDARHWPVKTNHPSRHVVSYETTDGQIQGAPGRRFLAQRNTGARFHVGIDLFARPGDEVIACENGRIVAFYEFYKSSAGEMTFALLVEHDSFVVNYGEVKGDSPSVFHWKVGDFVNAGQPIARVSSTSMTHFETYRVGTKRNYRWLPGQARPAALLNPTAYLLQL